jgi:methylated-DNA-[protein]-cysteine S-methyltransferase
VTSRAEPLVRSKGMDRFICFDTTLGRCALVWGERGIVGVHLPGNGGDAATRRRIRRGHPSAQESAPPPAIVDAVARITRLFEGEPDDLCGIALDTAGVPEFNRRVFAVTRTIPPGETRSYGEVAERVGERGAAQAVGRALGQNPFPIVVPCHRVVAADGRLTGFSAPGGVDTKRRMLEIEGAMAPALF